MTRRDVNQKQQVFCIQFIFTLDLNGGLPYPFIYHNFDVKSLPFHIPKTRKRHLFQEPPCIGHYREYFQGKRFAQGKYSLPCLLYRLV